MIEFEPGSTNVYADLDFPDADEMFRKAQLATEINRIIQARRWTRHQAAAAMGLPQPQLSDLLRGRFRGISETKMLDCLARLGCDVEIVVAPRRDATAGRIAVSFSDTR